MDKHNDALVCFRRRKVEGFSPKDESDVKKVFKSFELILGPVGAAKGLHLLAPYFFPLWDRAIAKGYHLALWARGWNGDRYCEFMKITKDQVKALGGERGIGRNPLKAIDEYNYCKARGWT